MFANSKFCPRSIWRSACSRVRSVRCRSNGPQSHPLAIPFGGCMAHVQGVNSFLSCVVSHRQGKAVFIGSSSIPHTPRSPLAIASSDSPAAAAGFTGCSPGDTPPSPPSSAPRDSPTVARGITARSRPELPPV